MKPFLPFARPSIDAESIAAVAEVFESGQLASGPKVHAFEAALAAYLGSGRHVRVMTSATAGLEMALEVAGVGEGDEVIVPAMSFAASANVVARVRAKPVFVDIDLKTAQFRTWTCSRRRSRPRTRAIMPVHFSGLPVDMDALHGIAAEHGLRVVEDAAHAIGSRYRGKLIGSFGDLVGVQLPSQQEHDEHRGRRHRHGGRGGGRAFRAVPVSRHQAQCPGGDRRAVSRARRAISPMWRRRSASISCAVWMASTRAAASSPDGTSRSSTDFRRWCCRRAATRGTAGTCSRC